MTATVHEFRAHRQRNETALKALCENISRAEPGRQSITKSSLAGPQRPGPWSCGTCPRIRLRFLQVSVISDPQAEFTRADVIFER